MAVKSAISLNNFFIFNSTLGPREGEVRGATTKGLYTTVGHFKLSNAINSIFVFSGAQENLVFLS